MADFKPRYLAEYALARMTVGMVDMIPPQFSMAVAARMGSLAFRLLGSRRRIAVANLQRTGVASSPEEARRIAHASFRHFAMLAVEALAAGRLITPDTLDKHAEIIVPESTAELLDDEEQGLLLSTGHLGNWEVVGHIISFRKPLVAVARRMDNPMVQRFMLQRNPRRNIEIISKHSRDKFSLLRALRRGRSLGLIMDQHASSHGVSVPFFGIPAHTVTSPARLHLATNCPIVCGYGIRSGFLRFKLEYSEPLVFDLSGDREEDIRIIMTELNRRLEGYIRRYPEQYLWSHRRWDKEYVSERVGE